MAMDLDRHRYAVIMAGRVGSRLWPLSRKGSPKQTLSLLGERTLFQLAVDRLLSILPLDRILVVTTQAQVATLARQYPDLPAQNFIVEPMGRGTAPCIGLAALHIQHRDPDGLMAVVTADHYIRNVPAFCALLEAAYAVADKGYLVTLGITPTFPSTGYGYIRVGEKLGEVHGTVYFRANAFIEKPDLARAKAFLAAGDRVWNSGMFVWRIDRILEEISLWMPELHRALIRLQPTLGRPEHDAVLRESWASLEKQTIDYGIMEHAKRVAVIPASIGWSDVGSWSTIMDLHECDEAGNVLEGDVIPVDTVRSMVLAHSERLVAIVGLEDVIVVDTPDALLITRRDLSERVREVVERLRLKKGEDLL